MKFDLLLDIIEKGAGSSDSFESVCTELEKRIYRIKKVSLLKLLVEIGSIPESIDHDSTAEKLFAKAADIVLAQSFREMWVSHSRTCLLGCEILHRIAPNE